MKYHLLLALLATGCVQSATEPQPPPPQPNTDIDPADIDSTKMCAGADRALRAAACKQADLPNGKTFETWCLEKRHAEPPTLSVAMVQCLAALKECPEVAACTRK